MNDEIIEKGERHRNRTPSPILVERRSVTVLQLKAMKVAPTQLVQ
jgi:hypothetical protein